MGRSPCCDKVGLKKGPWTPEEDQKLLAYIDEHGHGSWRALPAKAGLQRCGKSCRLRWTNYLRPDIKRGKFSLEEEQTIIQLHALLGNRWSAIATHLPKRTDNEIKNYWNTHLKKRLAKMGIDPVTHKPKNDALLSGDGQSKNSANLSHMAQWESARLEAEARLVRESKLRSRSIQHQLTNPGYSPASRSSTPTLAQPARSLDALKIWNGGWSKPSESNAGSLGAGVGDLESPTSTLTFSENALPILNSTIGESSIPITDFVGTTTGSSDESIIVKDEGEHDKGGLASSSHLSESNSVSFSSSLHEMSISMERNWNPMTLKTNSATWNPMTLKTNSAGDVHADDNTMEEGFTSLLLGNNPADRRLSDSCNDSDNNAGSGSDDYEDNKNYWNSIFNLVDSSPPNSPMF